MKKPSLLLVGYGRFGSFAAHILLGRFSVHVLEHRRGVRLGPSLKRASIKDLDRFGIVILALPAHRLEAFLRRYGQRFRPGAFIADVCAVKDAPSKWMKRHLPEDVSFAGLHPLFGPDSAATGVRGHTIVVCRGRTTPACHRRLLSTLRKFGLKAVETNPVIHDRSMASTLFLTQFIGSILPPRMVSDPPPLATPAWQHLSLVAWRAAGNSPELLEELYRYNPFCAICLRHLKNHFHRESGRLEALVWKLSR